MSEGKRGGGGGPESCQDNHLILEKLQKPEGNQKQETNSNTAVGVEMNKRNTNETTVLVNVDVDVWMGGVEGVK